MVTQGDVYHAIETVCTKAILNNMLTWRYPALAALEEWLKTHRGWRSSKEPADKAAREEAEALLHRFRAETGQVFAETLWDPISIRMGTWR